MNIESFKLERYFAKYEFSTKYLLSSSDCDGYALNYVLAQASTEELELWHNLILGYTESEGNSLLRTAISSLYKTITPKEIVVSSPGEANFMLMNCLLESGDHVICMSPAYQSLYQVAKTVGAQLSFWKPRESNWYYDPDELAKLIQPNTKLIIINFPHNPTGAFPSPEELQQIVEIARKADCTLFSDEMYRLLTHPPHEEIPAVCDVYEKGISVWGMAKTFGLAGLRIGWTATHDAKVLQQILRFKDYLSICNSAPSEILSYIAIQHKEKFIQPNLNKILKNINLFQEFLSEHPSLFDFTPPKAGSIGFIKHHFSETALDFSETLIKATGIMTLPSEMFEYGSQHFRIGFGRENFGEILEILGNYLKKERF